MSYAFHFSLIDFTQTFVTKQNKTKPKHAIKTSTPMFAHLSCKRLSRQRPLLESSPTPACANAAQVVSSVQIHVHETTRYACFAVVLFFPSKPRHTITPAAVKVMNKAAT